MRVSHWPGFCTPQTHEATQQHGITSIPSLIGDCLCYTFSQKTTSKRRSRTADSISSKPSGAGGGPYAVHATGLLQDAECSPGSDILPEASASLGESKRKRMHACDDGQDCYCEEQVLEFEENES